MNGAGEGYWQHFRFATTFGLAAMAVRWRRARAVAARRTQTPSLAMAAGSRPHPRPFRARRRCWTRARTASRIVRHLGQLLEDRSKIDAIESEAVEARAFVLLLILGDRGRGAAMGRLDAPMVLRVSYTLLAFALPAALMISNPELISAGEDG